MSPVQHLHKAAGARCGYDRFSDKKILDREAGAIENSDGGVLRSRGFGFQKYAPYCTDRFAGGAILPFAYDRGLNWVVCVKERSVGKAMIELPLPNPVGTHGGQMCALFQPLALHDRFPRGRDRNDDVRFAYRCLDLLDAHYRRDAAQFIAQPLGCRLIASADPDFPDGSHISDRARLEASLTSGTDDGKDGGVRFCEGVTATASAAAVRYLLSSVAAIKAFGRPVSDSINNVVAP